MRAIYEGCYLDSLRTTAAENGATNALYMAGFGTNANSSTVPNLGQLYALPLFSGQGGTVITLALNVNVAGGAGSVARIGVYSTITTGAPLPQALVLDGGSSLDCTLTGLRSHTGLSFVMQPDTLYWLAVIFGVAAPTVFGVSGDAPVFGFSNTQSAQIAYTKTGVTFGALPTIFPLGGFPTSTAPGLFVEFGSLNHY